MRMPSISVLAGTLALASQLLIPVASAQQAPFTTKAFTDVKTTDPHYDAIEYLRTNNILKGYPDGTFKPNEVISRAEFTVLFTNPFFLDGTSNCLQSNFGSGSTTQVYFPDVRKDDWFADAVCTAKSRGIIDGYPDGTFQPGHTIIVAEAAKIAAKVFAIDVRRDNNGVDDKWYSIYIQTLGGLNAIPPSIHSVSQAMTRGEMAELIFRLKTKNTDKTATSWQELLNK